MTRLLTFEVYRSRYPSSDLGERFDDVEARDHRAAKELARSQHPGIQVVVLPKPARRTIRDRRADGGRTRTTHPRPRP